MADRANRDLRDVGAVRTFFFLLVRKRWGIGEYTVPGMCFETPRQYIFVKAVFDKRDSPLPPVASLLL